jgi:hypothetical protein
MIAMVRCLRRQPHVTPGEFQDHWLLRARAAIGAMPLVRRSVQYHAVAEDPVRAALPQARTSAAEAYDGASIEWFDDVKALAAHLEGEGFGLERSREDWFIDHARSTVQLVRPEVIIEPEAVDLVLFECLKRRPGQDFGEFTRIWHEHAVHGLNMRDHGWLRGYYQLHLLEPGPPPALVAALGTEPVEWDGFVLPYFASIVDIKAMSNSAHNQPGHEHALTFVDLDAWLAMTTRRYVIRELVS